MIIDSIPRNRNTPLIISAIKIIKSSVLSKTRVTERSRTYNTGLGNATNGGGGAFLANAKAVIGNAIRKPHISN